MSDTAIRTNPDVILIGAGIMSATLGVILKELQPIMDCQPMPSKGCNLMKKIDFYGWLLNQVLLDIMAMVFKISEIKFQMQL